MPSPSTAASPLLAPCTLPSPALRLPHALSWAGIGLHHGERARLSLHPCSEAGWWLVGEHGKPWPLTSAVLADARYTSVVALPDGRRLGGLEHVLAALSALWVEGVVLELEGSEAPALDGCAETFVRALATTCVPDPSRPRRALRLLRELHCQQGDSIATLRPARHRQVRCELSFPGHERESACWEERGDGAATGGAEPAEGVADFASGIAPARTFAFAAWLDTLRDQGLARGGSLDNALVLDAAGRALNPGGFRFDNELARHKLLDVLGDLARLGAPLLGEVDLVRPGHAFNGALVDTLRGPHPFEGESS